jgi:hypothetical protein
MVTQSLMNDVLIGAFEGGLEWCLRAFVCADEPRGGVESDSFYAPKNFVWNLRTEDGPTSFNQAKLAKAIQAHPGDPDNWDVCDYDEIVQMACFDEVIYG